MPRTRVVALVLPLLVVGVGGVLVAAATGQLHAVGAVRSGFRDGSDLTGRTTVDGIPVTIDRDGDWLRAVVPLGHRFEVRGYSGEPALRVRADGATEHDGRDALGTTGPDDAGPPTRAAGQARASEPTWSLYSEGGSGNGTLVWHDHRAHWSGGVPGASDGEQLATWTLDADVDDRRSSAPGALVWEEPGVVRLAGALVVALVAGGLAALRRRASPTAPLTKALGAAVIAAGIATAASLPDAPIDSRVWLTAVAELSGAAAVLGIGPTLSTKFRFAGDAIPVLLLVAWLLPRARWTVLAATAAPSASALATVGWAGCAGVVAVALVVLLSGGSATTRTQ